VPNWNQVLQHPPARLICTSPLPFAGERQKEETAARTGKVGERECGGRTGDSGYYVEPSMPPRGAS